MLDRGSDLAGLYRVPVLHLDALADRRDVPWRTRSWASSRQGLLQAVGLVARALSQIGVLTAPGSTTDTAMPHGRSSARSDSPIASIANFDAQYGPVSAVATLPLIEPMNTIRPRGDADERQHRLGHRDLPEHVHLQLLAPVLQAAGTPAGRPGPIPALLTTPSRLPPPAAT